MTYRKRFCWKIATAVLGLTGLTTSFAAPVTIDFGDGDYIQFFNPSAYAEDGFLVRSGTADGHIDILNSPNGDNPALAPLYTGPDRDAEIHTGFSGETARIERDGGGTFSLIQLDIERLVNPPNGSWRMEASNGSIFTFTATGTLTFGSEWSNITFLRLFSTATFPDFLPPRLYFDNIVLDVDQVRPSVPEPATLGLLLSGLAGLAMRKRRAVTRASA